MSLLSIYNKKASIYAYMSLVDCTKTEYKMTCEILSAIETIIKERVALKENASITPSAGTLLKITIEQIAVSNLVIIKSGLRSFIEAIKIALDIEMMRIALAWTSAITQAASKNLPPSAAILLDNDLISIFDENFKPLIPSIIKTPSKEKNIKGLYILSKAINQLIENEIKINRVHG